MRKEIRVDQLRDIYYKLKPEGKWFDAGGMQFFRTVIFDSYRVEKDGVFVGCLFLTQETGTFGDTETRKFTIRWLKPDGEVISLPEFFTIETRHKADKLFKEYLLKLETHGFLNPDENLEV